MPLVAEAAACRASASISVTAGPQLHPGGEEEQARDVAATAAAAADDGEHDEEVEKGAKRPIVEEAAAKVGEADAGGVRSAGVSSPVESTGKQCRSGIEVPVVVAIEER